MEHLVGTGLGLGLEFRLGLGLGRMVGPLVERRLVGAVVECGMGAERCGSVLDAGDLGIDR